MRSCELSVRFIVHWYRKAVMGWLVFARRAGTNPDTTATGPRITIDTA
jgi:hypothetical protein